MIICKRPVHLDDHLQEAGPSFVVVCCWLLFVVGRCMSFVIVCRLSLFVVGHCLSLVVVCRLSLIVVVCLLSLFVVCHCLSFDDVCHLLSFVYRGGLGMLSVMKLLKTFLYLVKEGRGSEI